MGYRRWSHNRRAMYIKDLSKMDFASRWVLMGLVGEMEKVHRPVALRRSTGFWFLKQVYFTGSQ